MMQNESKRMRDKAAKRGRTMRDRATSTAMKRKEEYLGARVPKELRDKVIRRAEELGMPVSILIRNVLEEAFRDQSGTRESGATRQPEYDVPRDDGGKRFPHVLGWEEIKLNRHIACASCGAQLQPGTSVTLGLAGPGEEHVILCQRCRYV